MVEGRNALVIDNDFFFVEFLSEILEKREYRVTKAYDGKEGILRLDEQPMDLVFVDMVMPKIDGQQFIEFVRQRYPEKDFPVVMISATLVEQLDTIKQFGADYYIAKGPMDKMAQQINLFLDRIERKDLLAFAPEELFESENIYPRRATGELIDSLNFERAITESLGLGLMVIDKDAKVLRTNRLALEILGTSLHGTLNIHIRRLFKDREAQRQIIQALKTVLTDQTRRCLHFRFELDLRTILAYASLLRIDGAISGWVLAMEDHQEWDVQV